MIKSQPLTHITLRVNGRTVPVSYFKFSAGEAHVKVDVEALRLAYLIDHLAVGRDVTRATYTANINSSDDIMLLVAVIDAVNNATCSWEGGMTNEVILPYLPYSRQDRVCAPGECFGLRMFARVIESVDISSVTTWDAHNPKAFRDIFGVSTTNIQASDFIASTLLEQYPDGVNIVAPDAGAKFRAGAVHYLATQLNQRSGFFTLTKDRDPSTGYIKSIVVDDEVKNITDPSLPFLIVDDICDGGRTFIGAHKALTDKFTVSKQKPIVDLFVTHGIFSAGFTELTKAFRHIYVANNVNGVELPKGSVTLVSDDRIRT